MKIMRRMLAVLTAAVLALSWAAAESGARPVETPADAEEWVRILLGEDPGALETEWSMTDQMHAALGRSGGMEGIAASLAPLGGAGRIGPTYEGEIQGYRTFYVPCAFEAMPVDLILVTQDGAVAGLSTGPYTGGQEDETTGSFRSIELALPVPALNGELPGTLLLPEGEGPFPAVVLVHGSGASDRDETLMALRPFRDLAEGLAARGIAVYRYDKRTFVYGAEMAADQQITLEDETIEDAAAAVQLLAQQDCIDPDRIWVLGHSLGGNAIPAVDSALRDMPVQACGYVMMAASPRPLDVLMREQAAWLLAVTPEMPPEQREALDRMLADLDRLADPDALTEGDDIAGAYAPYWLWLADYDALAAAAEITLPCLLLQGEEDYQVTMEDFAVWQEAFGGAENWRLVSFPGLTHCFTPGLKTEGSAAYARPEHVDEGVIDTIAAFMRISTVGKQQ